MMTQEVVRHVLSDLHKRPNILNEFLLFETTFATFMGALYREIELCRTTINGNGKVLSIFQQRRNNLWHMEVIMLAG